MKSNAVIPNVFQLELRAICETWHIEVEKADQSRLSIIKKAPYHLSLKLPSLHKKHIIEALDQWLKRKAKRHLTSWIRAISEDMELPFKKLAIRGQKTRWGSCSSRKNINLNYKLLFLPALLTEYILTHELCHTVELNHSKQFWSLVESHIPDWREHRKVLREAHLFLPSWGI